jgi:hypothetical protein
MVEEDRTDMAAYKRPSNPIHPLKENYEREA